MALNDYITEKPVIETNRLIIRELTSEDIPALKQWLADKAVYTYWGKGPSKAEKNPELLFAKTQRPTKSFHLGIEEKHSAKVIGDLYVYLIEKDRMAAVAIRIAPACQCQGYGSEALASMTRFCFENTELQRLWAQVDARNLSSQKMLEKCGYTKEGLVRQGRMVNSWCDYYLYGMLKSDVEAVIKRVREMEDLFDQLSMIAENDDETAMQTEDVRKAARRLARYLDSGLWLKDYQLDELGLLPKDLKRGVLSQDGLYDLLDEPAVKALLKD
jgi:ribosomal-protein-alanine N-acetyltransferase